MHFDWTISIGNVITATTVFILAAMAWKDLVWRIKNLESWRTEHMIDADARDSIIMKIDILLERFKAVVDDREGRSK
jgi:hypothetical protein